jgi:riboflavin transporter FmnP
MKSLNTIFLTPLAIGVTIAVFGVARLWHNGFGIFHCAVAVVAGLSVVVIIGTLLNLAVFAPIYWLLGRLHSKKIKTEAQLGPHA